MIFLRILLGILKGGIIGGGLGAALWAIDPNATTFSGLRWVLYGVVGFLTGVVAGKPPWAPNAAWVATILKAVVGFGVCVGLYFLSAYLMGMTGFQVYGREPTLWYFAFGGALGILYGVWVEIDDGGKADDPKKKQLPAKEQSPALPGKKKD